MRVLTAATVLVFLLLPAAAGGTEVSGRALPPRPFLPTVDFSIGYPGGYLPNGSVPIEVRARAADRPFDGAISFRFRLHNRHSSSTPVIMPVHLAPGETWAMRTWAHIPYYGNRQIEIEWRDAALAVIGSVRALDLPRHDRRVLRVGAAEAPTTLGLETYPAAPEALSEEAQWYAGFETLTIPTATWLDLPLAKREAILGSGIFVLFTGFPRAGQTLGPVDRALLPVSFEQRPSAYTIPWPYAKGEASRTAAPMAWRPVSGASAFGSSDAPYLVTTGYATAAWAADDRALERDLPAMQIAGMGKHSETPSTGSLPSLRQMARSYTAMLVTIVAALLSLALWLVSRRAPRWAVATVALAASILIIGADARIRPVPDRHDIEIITPLSAGLVDHYRGRYDGGAAPLAELPRPGDLTRTSLNGTDDIDRAGEVRTASAAPGAGSMFGYGDYEAAIRWSSRREPGTEPKVQIVRADAQSLTVRFEAADPIEQVVAFWKAGGKSMAGSVTVSGRKTAEVTVPAWRFAWRDGAFFLESTFRQWALARGERQAEDSGMLVSLVHRSRTATKEVRWWRPALPASADESLRVRGMLRRTAPDVLSGLFVVPGHRLPTGHAFVSVPYRIQTGSVTLTWPGGSVATAGSKGEASEVATRAFPIPQEVLRAIAASGGMVEVTIRGAGLPTETTSSIELWGKS